MESTEVCPNGLRETFLADLGELAGPLAHEVNNLLNNISLHLAVIQQTSLQPLHGDLLTIRKDVERVAEVVSQHQRYRNKQTLEPATLDLNSSVRKVVENAARVHPKYPIVLETAPQLPAIQGYEADVRRLCKFLVGNAIRAMGESGSAVVVRTLLSGGAPLLEIEDSGEDIPSEALPRLFDIGPKLREGMCSLELAACRSIVRRLNGNLQARGRFGGGLITAVHFRGG
jgi:signal transduction histidine kinase